ncbi:unnamed protein product, partial [Mesorhabditis belari]|uniref:Uncharacterized protein n=1 Tax=Mesorhabditis belari TaxID=2138241 RepID=A0AAF3EQX6_9BILA
MRLFLIFVILKFTQGEIFKPALSVDPIIETLEKWKNAEDGIERMQLVETIVKTFRKWYKPFLLLVNGDKEKSSLEKKAFKRFSDWFHKYVFIESALKIGENYIAKSEDSFKYENNTHWVKDVREYAKTIYERIDELKFNGTLQNKTHFSCERISNYDRAMKMLFNCKLKSDVFERFWTAVNEFQKSVYEKFPTQDSRETENEYMDISLKVKRLRENDVKELNKFDFVKEQVLNDKKLSSEDRKKIAENLEQVLARLNDLLHSCFMERVIYGNFFHRQTIAAFVDQMIGALTKFALSVPACYLSETHADYHTQSILSRFDAAKNITIWLYNKLSNTTAVEEVLAKRTITNFLSKKYFKKLNFATGQVIGACDYQLLAEEISETLKDLGFVDVRRQILVLPTSSIQISSHFVCPQNSCILIKNERGVDVMITHFDDQQLDHLKEFSPFVENEKKKILDVVKKNSWEDFGKLMELLVSGGVAFTNETLSRSFAMVRHKISAFKGMCNVSGETVSYRLNRVQTEHIFHYTNVIDRGVFDDYTCYSFYFFA